MSGASEMMVDITSEEDLVRTLRAARQRGQTVRAVGAMGSKNGCCRTTGIVLNLDRYADVVEFRGDTVTIQAGMRVGRLNAFLRERGKLVPTCGEWQGATVVGSTATGSHGGSAHYGIHSTSIRSIRLVTSDGTVREIDRADADFDHAAVSLGLLGVISTITLDCVDTFFLELETRVLRFEEFLRDHHQLNQSAEFFASVWFPSARRVMIFAANRVPASAATGPRRERFSVATILLDAASRYFNVHAVSDRMLAGRSVDSADRILCPIADRSKRVQTMRAVSSGVKAMEAALPLSQAPDALASLDRLLHAHRYARMNAVGLRTSLADSFSLSPCFERDTLWADVFFLGGMMPFTRALTTTLEELQGRCHWGKHIGLGVPHFEAQYRRLPEFRRRKATLDPNETFGSPFTQSIGL